MLYLTLFLIKKASGASKKAKKRISDALFDIFSD